MLFICLSSISWVLLLTYIAYSRKKLKKLEKAHHQELALLCNQYGGMHSTILEQTADIQEYIKRIEKLKYRDNLTGLPNRISFMDRLEQQDIMRKEGGEYALIFIDIDNFKHINDSFGHDFGDRLLILVSELIKIILPENAALYRWGGDEFLIGIFNDKEISMLPHFLDKIFGTFSKPFEIGNRQIYITLSLGVSFYPGDSLVIGDLVKNAEIAMYEAKLNGKCSYSFFDDYMSRRILRKNLLEKHLYSAIENNEFRLVFQPQYDVDSKMIVGYESLIRWNNDELGNITPTEFIPIAEESSLMRAIGNWVLLSACTHNKKLVDRGIRNRIAVNISAVQFEQENFYDVVKETLKQTGMPPHLLELEITETAVIKSLEKSIQTIRKIRSLGVMVSLDDFGTGYSSLNYLRKLPIDNLKIDKSFIDDLEVSDFSGQIITAIIQLAHRIDLKVIAEGVETENQYLKLLEYGCDFIQGFYFSKPVDGNTLDYLLQTA